MSSKCVLVQLLHGAGTAALLPDGLLAIAKFQRLVRLVELVAAAKIVGAVIAGEPGVGKSVFTVRALKAQGLVEGADFAISKGHASPLGLYGALVKYNGKVLVVDDSDDCLKNKLSLSLLKPALEDLPERRVSFLSSRLPENLPSEFVYTGRLIFLTNHRFSADRDPDRAAIRSRCHYTEIYLTLDEKLDFIQRVIVPQPHKGSSLEERQMAFNLLREASLGSPDGVNFRTYRHVLDLLMFDAANIDMHLSQILPSNANTMMLFKAIREEQTTEAACRRYVAETGMSRRQFYYLRRRYASVLG